MTRKDRTEGIYNRREVLDESERRQYCLIQLKDLLSYAYRYSEDVKKRFDRAQFNVEKFKTLSDIKHIPLLKKKELIFLQSIGPRLGGLLTKDIGELKRIFLSPGPIFDPEDRMDDYWGYTEAFYSVGFRPGDVVQVTFNYHLSPAGLMFEEPLRNLGCASIPAGPTDPGTQLDIMQKLRVSGYVGTASYLMHLAQKAEEKGINLRKDLISGSGFCHRRTPLRKDAQPARKEVRHHPSPGLRHGRRGLHRLRVLPQDRPAHLEPLLRGNLPSRHRHPVEGRAKWAKSS